jgi:ABC-type lipoprotein export system ATPase subunit
VEADSRQDRQVPPRHCGFIFQGFNLFPALTAKQQVMTVLKYQGHQLGEGSRQAVTTLEEVGLGPRMNQRRPNCRAARSSASPSPAPWPSNPS